MILMTDSKEIYVTEGIAAGAVIGFIGGILCKRLKAPVKKLLE